MRRIDESIIDKYLEDYLMQDKNRKWADMKDPEYELLSRNTRHYLVDNIRDLLDNIAELTLTEPLPKKTLDAINKAHEEKYVNMSDEEYLKWYENNFDDAETDKWFEYMRVDFSLKQNMRMNLVKAEIHNVYAMKFTPQVHKTWEALEFEVYDGTGAMIKAIANYRVRADQNHELLNKSHMLQNINGSEAVDLVFNPLPIVYTNQYGQERQGEPCIEILEVHKESGKRDRIKAPVPVEYATR